METTSPTTADPVAQTDLPTAIQQILAASPEPLTVSKIRAQLPPPLRTMSVEELAEFLQRQAAAKVLVQYPKYRSQQDRYWDRPMEVHVAALINEVLQAAPLGVSELRRKLPSYAAAQVELVLTEQVNQRAIYRHPRARGRGGDRFGVRPADPKEYLRSELAELFLELEALGFTQEQLREGALELLHEEEWASTISQARQSASEGEAKASEAPEQAAGTAATPSETPSP